ncbi:aminomethyl-transferring glycine dehydrogenase [Microcella frigidaquae]|uniref:Glycine dehydrogenase (decarboxylating) n=1 Tax=Microcella frigidaquae TaxID=424758 RepID=A0A840XRV3_9MICO|nr:aminomethyl-transferring glycine dehydrogenase [Microcella frigidaquae]MBB5618649.1 glycine dehydrogenase [Microcella frigidaquae]NHN44083.1 aminomethyl-transferring glycine dehydrogenase [Microcella frigidaquae]
MSLDFSNRHIGIDGDARQLMLDALGYASLDALMDAAVPAAIRQTAPLRTLPVPATEAQALAELRAIAAENRVRTSLIGQGYYGTVTPAVIQRNVLENPSWYTAYTPYQPEISQGRLEALLNFQTMVSDLTGLHTANASMLDEATAVVEGMLLARRASGSASNVFLVDSDLFAQTRAVLDGRAEALGLELAYLPLADTDPAELPEAFGVFVQYPAASGRIWDPSAVIARVKEQGGLAIVAADLLALTLITSPGELGADVAVGTTQRFGVPMGFGGPHAGYLAVREGLERQMPGRLVGVSKDADGRPAYRLTLQTREQHIRRDKATSNICTAQVLLAVMASMYGVYHGPDGLRRIAERIHRQAVALATHLRGAGYAVAHDAFFDTLEISAPGRAAALAAAAREHDLLLWQVDADTLRLSVDEVTSAAANTGTAADIGPALAEVFGLGAGWATAFEPAFPADLRRASEYMTHPVFHTHRSETSMMRYLKRLADRDYALDRGMIPLGSCTMKLNAATEMAAVTWPEFSGLHPFAPVEDVQGSLILIGMLETWLAELTGYDAVSLQPNAGSQGELAGLLAIRGYHRSRGDLHRTVCLIPSSAHGTNAASAVLAGMRVVVVGTTETGDVDLADLRAKIAEHRDELAALMITYPSTHGVYEHEVMQVTAAVHEAGGQVYIDGANLNALLGYARYGDLGGDVSHLNLHKTFCIPHGGGGPGVGPVAAKAHLAPFLPGHPLAQMHQHPPFDMATGAAGTVEHRGAPVSAAPYGSASILPISWAYARMMGAEGLTDATANAVLAANYVALRLREHYPVLYAGENGLVAHECILDLRPLKEATGIGNDDVAKRLMDYGFHAPTMSFPVAGTLMVEPTESEDLAELERFIQAMIAIRHEADRVAAGEWPADDNPLVNAPHTAESVIAGEWEHPYSRELAVYPFAGARVDKYWPPVRRVDQAYGDRNLVCACPPISEFA